MAWDEQDTGWGTKFGGFFSADVMNLDKEEVGFGYYGPYRLKGTPQLFNPNPSKGFFDLGPTQTQSTTFVTLDIETNDRGVPISISALKQERDPKTGRLKTIGTYQRYYKSKNRDLVVTEGVHEFTSKKLDLYRKQQGATYSETYNANEKAALTKFMGNSILVGHNVVDFDLKVLGLQQAKNQVFDTYTMAQNIWGGKYDKDGKKLKLGLDDTFKRLYHKSMAQAGLEHHNSSADVIANALILEKALQSKGVTGKELRAMMKYRKLMYGPKEELSYMNGDRSSALFLGNYLDYAGSDERYRYYTAQTYLEKKNLIKDGQLRDDWGPNTEGFNIEESGRIQEDIDMADSSMNDALRKITTTIGGIGELSSAVHDMTAQLTMGKRGQVISLLARTEDERWDDVARAYHIPKVDREAIYASARGIREKQSFSTMFSDLKSAVARGEGDLDSVRSMRKELSEQWAGWNGGHVRQLEMAGKIAQERKDNKFDSFLDASGLSEKQKDYIRSLQDEGREYDELVKKIQELNEVNRSWGNTLHALGNIKAYDPNQFVKSAGEQFGGISSAAKGIIPSPFIDVWDRYVAGGIASTKGRLVGHNRFMSVWNSGIGNAATSVGGSLLKSVGVGAGIGALGGTAVAPGVGSLVGGIGGGIVGLVKGITQVVGNVKQGKMEAWGYGVQSSLNAVGAIVSYVSVPFKLLGKAAKTLAGSFIGLVKALANIMTGGLNLMTQMGNPLESLTGVDYGGYMGSVMVDNATLQGRGSMNTLYNKTATDMRGLYTLGQVDQNKMIAAAMLGVFNDIYTPSNDVQGAVNNTINKMYADMQKQSPEQRQRTMYLAGLIDPSMQDTLRTMELLGVSDVKTLQDPRKRGMYWNPIDTENGEEAQMRWAQYEWGAAKEGLNTAKMRAGKTLWNTFGKSIYNGLAETMDKVARGDWGGAMDSIVKMWKTFKDKIVGIWDSFKASLSKKNEKTGLSTIDVWSIKLKNALIDIGVYAIQGLKTISSLWTSLVTALIGKARGFIADASTWKIDLTWENGRPGFKISSGYSRNMVSDKDTVARYGYTGSRDYRTAVTRQSDNFVSEVLNQLGIDARVSKLGEVKNAVAGEIARRGAGNPYSLSFTIDGQKFWQSVTPETAGDFMEMLAQLDKTKNAAERASIMRHYPHTQAATDYLKYLERGGYGGMFEKMALGTNEAFIGAADAAERELLNNKMRNEKILNNNVIQLYIDSKKTEEFKLDEYRKAGHVVSTPNWFMRFKTQGAQ